MGPLKFLNTGTKNTRFGVSALMLNMPGKTRQGNLIFQWFSLLTSTRILLGSFQHICAGSPAASLNLPNSPCTAHSRSRLSPNSCCFQPGFSEYWAFPHGWHRGRWAGSEHFPSTPALPVQTHGSGDKQSIGDSSDYHGY